MSSNSKNDNKNKTDEQLHFNAPAALMKLRYLAVMMSLTSTFMESDMDNLEKAKDTTSLKALLRQKIKYLQHLAIEVEENISQTLPQVRRSSRAVSRFCFENDISDDFVLVTPPPAPYVDGAKYNNIQPNIDKNCELPKHLSSMVEKAMKNKYHHSVYQLLYPKQNEQVVQSSVPVHCNVSSNNNRDTPQSNHTNNIDLTSERTRASMIPNLSSPHPLAPQPQASVILPGVSSPPPLAPRTQASMIPNLSCPPPLVPRPQASVILPGVSSPPPLAPQTQASMISNPSCPPPLVPRTLATMTPSLSCPPPLVPQTRASTTPNPSCPPPLVPRTQASSLSTTSSPAPTSTIEYPEELSVIDIIKQHDAISKSYLNNQKRGMSGEQFLNGLIKSRKLPVGRSTFYKLKKDYFESVKNGTVALLEDSMDWKRGDKGRPTLISVEEAVELLIHDVAFNDSISLKDIRSKLTNIKVRKAVAKGAIAALVRPVSLDTAKTYQSIILPHIDVNLRMKLNSKNLNRYIGERSVFSTVWFLIAICSTHFIASKEKYKNSPAIKSIKDATAGAQRLYDMVKGYYGRLHVTPIHPAFVLSTDDSTVYAVQGIKEKDEEWKLVRNHRSSRKIAKDKDSSSVNNTNNSTTTERIKEVIDSTYGQFSTDPSTSANLGGKRVRITVTTTASGQIAPIFITVYGLSERELPSKDFPDGVFVTKVPGLCMGGNQDINVNSFGYLAFVRKSKESKEQDEDYMSPDSFVYKMYRELVVFPFVRKLRAMIYNQHKRGVTDDSIYNVSKEETDIFKTCASWCDGGNPQIRINKLDEEVQQSNKEKIINNKHSRSRSTTEQPNDIMPGFQIIETSAKCTTAQQNPFLQYRQEIEKVMKDIEKNHGIYLHSKKKHIIDFLTMAPSIFFKAMSPQNIVKGFIGNGMLDMKSYQWPDYDAIMATCKSDLITQDWVQDIIVKNFDKMMEEYSKKGYLSDEFLKALGLPEDRDRKGDIVVRDVTMKNEKEHRAKTFTHPYWVKVRREIIEQELQKLRQKAQDCSDKVLKHHDQNKKIENLLREALGQHSVIDPAKPLDKITLKMIYDVDVPADNLSSFVYVRKFKEFEKGNKIEVTYKRKWKEIEAGRSSVVNLIHNHRNDPIILEDPLDCLVRFRRELGLVVENDN